jgi:hypothetical protein
VITYLTTRAFLVATAIAVAAAPAPRKRSVEMAITLPNGAVANAAAPEDDGVVIKLVDGSRFGFVPAVSPSDDSTVAVSLWDVDARPMKKLGTVTAAVGGAEVNSGTSPAFLIRVVKIVKPK